MNRARRAFTLIELMVVVVIIGILAAIAIPRYRDITLKANAAAIVADTRVIVHAAQLYLADNGHYPQDGWWGEVPPDLAPYLPEDFSFSRAPELDVMYSLDNAMYPVEMGSYARSVGMWVSVSVWTKDQSILNMIMEVAPDYMVPAKALWGRKRVAAVLVPY